jgi:hypothetical protein
MGRKAISPMSASCASDLSSKHGALLRKRLHRANGGVTQHKGLVWRLNCARGAQDQYLYRASEFNSKENVIGD